MGGDITVWWDMTVITKILKKSFSLHTIPKTKLLEGGLQGDWRAMEGGFYRKDMSSMDT